MSAEQQQTRTPRPALGVLAQRIGEVSPAWAAATVDPDAAPQEDLLAPTLGRDRAQGVEAIREGWLLHRAASRVSPGADEDLALLMGDWSFAQGLCTIADHGSLDDVARLAALVARVSADAHLSVDELAPAWSDAETELRHG